DELGDEEVSLDSDSGSEDAKDEGPAVRDEDPGSEAEGERSERSPPVQTPPSPDWTPGSLPISPSHSDVPSPLISLTVPSPVATLTATIPVYEDQFIDVGAQLKLYRSIL
ncbi:hypothetical protein Tco_0244658, partial [Tanacetum coccineum]